MPSRRTYAEPIDVASLRMLIRACSLAARTNAKRPGLRARAFSRLALSLREGRTELLTRCLEGLGHLMLDRLRGVGGDLRGQSPDLTCLTREHIELAADEGRLELDDFAERLGAGELLGEVEGGVEIALSKVDKLAIERRGALACGVERPLKCV